MTVFFIFIFHPFCGRNKFSSVILAKKRKYTIGEMKKKLIIDYNLDDYEFKQLCDDLKIDTTCVELIIINGTIGNIRAIAIADVLKNNKTLHILYIGWNSIEDDGAKFIVEALKINTSLHTLDIEWNYIGNKGAKAFAELLKINTSLRALGLGKNGIGDEGVKAFVEVLKFNISLCVLTGIKNHELEQYVDINSRVDYWKEIRRLLEYALPLPPDQIDYIIYWAHYYQKTS